MATSLGNPGSAVALDPLPSGQWATADAVHEGQFADIRKLLEDEVFMVDFFQAVRLLERMERDRNPVGYFVMPNSETIRFSSLPTLAFPPSQLYQLERQANGQFRLVVQFMGVSAAITIMPYTYTEYLLGRLRAGDTAMADFLDVFNHRIISLFYRAWEKYRFFIGYESRGQDSLTPRILDFLGMGTAGLLGRSQLPDKAYLAYAGLLGRHVRSAGGLKQILEDYFGVSITIQQFAGTWRSLPLQNQSVLQGSHRASERLGVGTVVGNEVWDHHGRIRISIGPMSFDRYVSFLPGNAAHKELADWVRFYSSEQYEAEVQLILHREEAPSCELGLRGDREPRLGLASWLKTKPLEQDPGDAVFLLG